MCFILRQLDAVEPRYVSSRLKLQRSVDKSTFSSSGVWRGPLPLFRTAPFVFWPIGCGDRGRCPRLWGQRPLSLSVPCRLGEFLEKLLDDHLRGGVQQSLPDAGDGSPHVNLTFVFHLGCLALRDQV